MLNYILLWSQGVMLIPEFLRLSWTLKVQNTLCFHIYTCAQLNQSGQSQSHSLPKLELPFFYQTVQLPGSVLQLLRFPLILLCTISQLVHPTCVGAAPHMSQLTSLHGIGQRLSHIWFQSFGITLNEQGTEVKARGSKAASAGFLIVLPSNWKVRTPIDRTSIMRQQSHIMARIYGLLSSGITGAQEAGVGRFQTLCHPTWRVNKNRSNELWLTFKKGATIQKIHEKS